MKVSWTRWATNQWLESFEYLQRENPSAAASRIGASVVETIAMLAAHPHAGQIGRIAGTREFAVPRSPFVIGYELDLRENVLRVLTVYDGRRRWPKDFARE
jgi:plasmid stabilization system protein ParE